MNIAYKKLSALVFSAIVTTSVIGMENENMVEPATEQVTSTAWYKKGSVQAAVVVTTALVAYAVAVRMNKAVVPAFITALFAAKLVQDSAPKSDVINNDSEQTTVDQNQNIIVMDTEEPRLIIVLNTGAGKTEESTSSFNSIKNAIENAIENITPEDLKRMNEELVR